MKWLFQSNRWELVETLFADQFTVDGRDHIYRKSMKGAAIRVSTGEREAFIADFGRRIRYMSWFLIAGTLALIVGLTVFEDDKRFGGNFALYAGLGIVLILFWAGYLWIWNAPVRELERRPEIAEALSRAEARKRALAKMSYAQLGISLLAPSVILLKVSENYDLLYGWNRLWLLGAAVFVLFVGIQAFRKWRSERAGAD